MLAAVFVLSTGYKWGMEQNRFIGTVFFMQKSTLLSTQISALKSIF